LERCVLENVKLLCSSYLRDVLSGMGGKIVYLSLTSAAKVVDMSQHPVLWSRKSLAGSWTLIIWFCI
jgi:hypothetical protein